MAVRMSIGSAKRMGVVSTKYDTRGKKVLTKVKVNKLVKNKSI